MVPRLVAFFLASALLVSGAAKKTTATGRGENEDLILNVTIYIDSAAVKEALGDDLGGHYIVAQVKVEPKYTKEIAIDRDDFVLRTDKDGDRTKPMAPNQVAGSGGVVLTRHDGPRGQGAERSRGGGVCGGGRGGGAGAGSPVPATRAPAVKAPSAAAAGVSAAWEWAESAPAPAPKTPASKPARRRARRTRRTRSRNSSTPRCCRKRRSKSRSPASSSFLWKTRK